MLLRSVPILEISNSTISPGFIQIGGWRKAPAPPVVPLTMTLPGLSGVNAEQYSISFGTSKIMSEVSVSCMTMPLSRVVICNAEGSGISSEVTSQGPNPPALGKFFPGVNWMVCFCQSRMLPSL